MRLGLTASDLPTRIATGSYVLHAGLEKWGGDEQRAAALHGMAASAYPFLGRIPPKTFLKALAAGEIATGSALLIPLVDNRAAGTALTGFAAGLIGMYLRIPALHQPGSIWPTQDGTAVSKDVWMLGIGLSLLTRRRDGEA